MWWGGFAVGLYVGILFMLATVSFIAGREKWRDGKRKMEEINGR